MRITSVALLAGCYHYEAGSLPIRLSCLDTDVQVTRDEQVTGPVLDYRFGNRCDHDVTVDIPAVHVAARDADGHRLQLAAFDPRREIHADQLPALMWGRERIAYDGDFAERDLVEVCVEIGALERGAPERWTCVHDGLERAR